MRLILLLQKGVKKNMSGFLSGALSGVLVFYIISFILYRSELMYDFSGWWEKHSQGFYKGTLIAALLGGLVIGLGGESGSSCKEFGRYATNC